VVINSQGRSFFVEVKFRSDPAWLVKTPLLKALQEYWQAKLILVTLRKPYFRVVDPTSLFEGDYSFEALEADSDFNITKDALEKFDPLVRFLLNGRTARQESVAHSR
jgi:hypothetical protein